MPNVAFENVGDSFRQQVREDMTEFFENNSPLNSALKRYVPSEEITEKGVRIAFWNRRPGGHTGWSPAASDFNVPVPPQSNSMWAFPLGYALPVIQNGTVMRGFQKDKKNALQTFVQFMGLYTETATKRINQMMHGDGSGALAYSASALGVGVASCNFTTTAAATPGQTKGAYRLEEGHSYNAINTATGAIRGTFTVNIPGKSSATINVTSGTIASGDPIVDLNSYNRWWRGIWHLIGNNTRVLQGLNTGNFNDLNDPMIDLNGQTLTPAAFRSVKSSLQTRNNREDAENSLFAVGTYGQYTVLCKQGYNLRFYTNPGAKSAVTGVANEYQDGDTVFIRDSDGDEDRQGLFQAEALQRYEEMPFGPYDLDNQEWRMLLGANGAGSDNYQQAIGTRMCLVKTKTRKTAGIQRASLTGVETQVNS